MGSATDYALGSGRDRMRTAVEGGAACPAATATRPPKTLRGAQPARHDLPELFGRVRAFAGRVRERFFLLGEGNIHVFEFIEERDVDLW